MCIAVQLLINLGFILKGSYYGLSSVDCSEDHCIEEEQVFETIRVKTDRGVIPVMIGEGIWTIYFEIYEVIWNMHVNRGMQAAY